MNPHRHSWGPAYYFHFVAIAAIATIISFLFSSESKNLPRNIVVPLLLCFIAWVTLTTLMAQNPIGARSEWERFIKIQILTFLALYLFQIRERVNWLIIVITGSIGFYSLKGGIFTITTGGIYRVSGPSQSFIEGNTELGFACTVILPLVFYLFTIAKHKLIKLCLIIAILLSIIGIIGTYSRGAFLALGILCIYFWWISRRKLISMVLLILIVPALFSLMPDKYFDRMRTIKSYEEDDSALGRINAWRFAINLANQHPIVGGGANAFTRELFARYAPEPERVHDAHSIYFEILGEQGYPGLLLFLALFFFSYRNCVITRRKSKDTPDLKWAYDLGRMLQACFVAYGVGGAFLGLAYFDLLYHLIALTVLLQFIVNREQRAVKDVVSEANFAAIAS
jgi:probable O-glycosylation ligase (exosortase A-associated)